MPSAERSKETFTAPQGASSKLLERQWQELQGIITWIAPTVEQAGRVAEHGRTRASDRK